MLLPWSSWDETTRRDLYDTRVGSPDGFAVLCLVADLMDGWKDRFVLCYCFSKYSSRKEKRS